MNVGIVLDERFTRHDTGPAHPERPDRLRAITTHLTETGLRDKLDSIEPVSATVDQIAAIHPTAYIDRVREACETGAPVMDCPDTPICAESYALALDSAGSAIRCVDAVMSGEHSGAFSFGRPPGHHAEKSQAMGFCLFNNIAVAAAHAIAAHGHERVAIVDFDVHHGNGTQQAFYDRGDVFFASCHEHPRFQYPGTGFEHETGNGDGVGTTLNAPLLPGSGDAEARAAFTDKLLPALEKFAPQLLLVSAGFDADARDPLGNLNWSTDTFAWMTGRLIDLAQTHCRGRMVCVLEGGYNLEALSQGVGSVLGEMSDKL